MKLNRLGRSEIEVTDICLGSMTWASQNTEAEAHEQLDYAVAEGLNFIDTAEMYPTTPRLAETTGFTEAIIGNWIAGRSNRDQIVLATKITGEGNKDIRNGARVTGATVREALEASLQRLKTDYVDLYQLHWPNRGSYHFRKYWTYDASTQDVGSMDQEVAEILGEVQKLQGEGKLREFGVSNETAWGMMKFLEASEKYGLPRIVSIQNEYNLLCRIYDTDCQEVSLREDVGLLAYSPLAAGGLSGKYMDGSIPEGSRRSMQANLNGRYTPAAESAIAHYAEVAKRHGLNLPAMALAFCRSRPFMTSTIIGATSMDQLKTNLSAAKLELGEAVLEDIQGIYRDWPQPM